MSTDPKDVMPIEENTNGLQVGDIVYASPVSCSSGRMGKDKNGYWRIIELKPSDPGSGWPPMAYLMKVLEDNGLPAKSKLPHRINSQMVWKITTIEAHEIHQKETDSANLKLANLLIVLTDT